MFRAPLVGSGRSTSHFDLKRLLERQKLRIFMCMVHAERGLLGLFPQHNLNATCQKAAKEYLLKKREHHAGFWTCTRAVKRTKRSA